MKCVVWSNSDRPRVYEVRTTSAMKAARVLGRATLGEVVCIYNKKDILVSRVIWDSCDRKYIRVKV